MGVIGDSSSLSDFEYDHPEVLEGRPAVSEGSESEAACRDGEGGPSTAEIAAARSAPSSLADRARALSDFEYDHPEVLEGRPAISEGSESEAAYLDGEEDLSDFEYDHPEVLEGRPAISEGSESEAAYLDGDA